MDYSFPKIVFDPSLEEGELYFCDYSEITKRTGVTVAEIIEHQIRENNPIYKAWKEYLDEHGC